MSTDGQQMEPFSAAVNAEARALGPPPRGQRRWSTTVTQQGPSLVRLNSELQAAGLQQVLL